MVHEASKVLSPAAEAFRYYLIEQAEGWLAARDGDLIGSAPDDKAASFTK